MLVANYGGGSVAVLPIGADGALKPATAFIQHTGSSVNPARQKQPYAHSVNVDSSDRFAYVADLGIDKVMIYRLDAAKGALAASEPPFAATQPGVRSASPRAPPAGPLRVRHQRTAEQRHGVRARSRSAVG